MPKPAAAAPHRPTVRVRAVPGALVVDPLRVRSYVGWARCDAAHAEHTIPTRDGGVHFRRVADGVETPDTQWVRLAIARRELELVTVEPARRTTKEA